MKTQARLGELNGEFLTIQLPRHDIEKLKGFHPGDICSVEIKRPKDKRSIEQNKMIWDIIGQIDKKVNGYLSDTWGIYIQIIRSAGIKREYEYVEVGNDKKLQELKEKYRDVQPLNKAYIMQDDNIEVVEVIIYSCLDGSSKFTKAEMHDFIEAVIDRAYQEGIDVLMYEDILRGGK